MGAPAAIFGLRAMRPKEEAYVGMNDKDTNYMIHGTRKRGHMLLNTTTGKGWP